MDCRLIRNELLNEEYYEINHVSGLKIFVMEKPDYSGAYAIFGTKYGSVDTCFRLKGEKEFTTVPEGIAHFLEHKLFESEELDAFERFAETGANANAYTSFDRTCYLFQCSGEFKKNLEILLDFVKAPYFTEETVQKEQGIIGQEIKMYQDSPDWQVLFNLLRGIYHNNPVRIDIAGTTDSIAKINAELLYSCYNTFYNLSNMALAVVGNVTKEDVLSVVEKVVKKEEPAEFEQIVPDEPEKVATNYIEEDMNVDMPKFALGFKCNLGKTIPTAKENLLGNIALEIIAGKVSPLYSSLMDKGLINSYFGSEFMCGRGFAALTFSGESSNPKEVRDEIIKEIEKIKADGIREEDFEVSLKRLYGIALLSFNDVDDMANNILDAYFNNQTLFDIIDLYKTVTVKDVQEFTEKYFDTDNCCLSVIK